MSLTFVSVHTRLTTKGTLLTQSCFFSPFMRARIIISSPKKSHLTEFWYLNFVNKNTHIQGQVSFYHKKNHNENDSQIDRLQLLTCLIIFQNDLHHRYWWEQTWKSLFHEHAECVRSQSPPSPLWYAHWWCLPSCDASHRWKNTGENGLREHWDKTKCIKYFPLSPELQNTNVRKSLTNFSNGWQNIQSLFGI